MRFYFTRFERKECVAGTYHLCLMLSLRAVRLRVWGFEAGAEITAKFHSGKSGDGK